MTDSIWTDTMDAKLLELWSAGKSKRDIGATLGKTRCSIIGRMNRLRLRASRERHDPIPERPKPPRTRQIKMKDRPTSGYVVHNIQNARAGIPKFTLETLVTGKGTPLLDLPRHDGCRYCTSDSCKKTVALFCGKPGFPWCDEHRGVAYRPRINQNPG